VHARNWALERWEEGTRVNLQEELPAVKALAREAYAHELVLAEQAAEQAALEQAAREQADAEREQAELDQAIAEQAAFADGTGYPEDTYEAQETYGPL
jgi:post-segregation antitoxin (ccd killing protein)